MCCTPCTVVCVLPIVVPQSGPILLWRMLSNCFFAFGLIFNAQSVHRHPPAVVHVLPEKRDRRLRPVLFDEGHVHVVHEVDEALQARGPVRLATSLCAAKRIQNERVRPGREVGFRSVYSRKR